MVQARLKHSPEPLHSKDLAVCRKVFDKIQSSAGFVKKSEEADRVATILVELYRQGVHEPDHLKTMVQAARGIFENDVLWAP